MSSSTPMRRDIRTRSARKATSNNNLSANNRQRSSSEPSVNYRSQSSSIVQDYTLLVEEHYHIDPVNKKLLPGLPFDKKRSKLQEDIDDDDNARDIHDFFNLICLVPVVILNGINWNWDILLYELKLVGGKKSIQDAWLNHSEYFPLFFAITIAYFVADLLWVILIPNCVKSPNVIIQHHIATLLYLIIPYKYPTETSWLMGACLSVEINTWLLIARRVFNKQNFGPWVFIGIRIKVISILFYITWISIRCIIYPIIMKLLCELWYETYSSSGYMIYQRYSGALILHSVFCLLNFKWTFDLFRSKYRALRSGNRRGYSKVDKGL